MKRLSANDVKALFISLDDGDVYQKSGNMIARSAKAGEYVITINAGKVETTNIASPDDMIIKNVTVGSSAEEYLVSATKLSQRYNVTEKIVSYRNHDWKVVEPTGKINGNFYTGPAVKFTAPWNEDMLLESGDFLGRPYPSDGYGDIYRIARSDFDATYTKVK